MLTALLLALAPALAVKWISDQELGRSRDLWLLAVLGLSALAVWPSAPWLTPILLWFLLFWRGMEMLPHVVTWIGIGVTWHLIRGLPAWAWEWLPTAWVAVAVYHVAILVVQWDRALVVGHRGAQTVPCPSWLLRLTAGAAGWRVARPWGLLGSGPTTALYLALVVSFSPLWLLPVFAVGLYLTGSYWALGAAIVGLGVTSPVIAPYVAWAGVLALLALVFMLWSESRNRRPWMPWLDRVSPHRASLDGLRVRLNAWRVVFHVARTSGWKVNIAGRRPATIEAELKRRAFRYDVALPEGGPFNDALWHCYDYGALGLASLVLFAWQVTPGIRFGDPWSAAWITGVALSLGHFPMRTVQVGLPWLAIGARLAIG